MPDIDDYVAAIRSAVYGEEVRGAIADAIEAMDDETKLVTNFDEGLMNLAKNNDISYLAKEHEEEYVTANDTISSSSVLCHTDYIPVPVGAESIMCGNLTSTSGGTTYHIIPNVLFYDENKNYIIDRQNNSDNIATYTIPSKAKFVRVNQPISTAPIKESLIRFIIADHNGYIGKYNVTFTSTAEAKGTIVYLEKGKPYTILCKSDIINGSVNAYVYGDTSIFARIGEKGCYNFIPDRSGYLYLYNINGNYTGDFEFEVYDSFGMFAKNQREPVVYEVGSDKAYKSLTELFLALKGDSSEKTIIVYGGDYDIFQEYSDLGLLDGQPPENPTMDYFNYNVWVPSNTHVIGKGVVRLLWEPEASEISQAWSKTISPVNVAGSVVLENIEIHCKNGRYCIHDDALGDPTYRDAVKKYKNIKCYREQNDTGYGFAAVIGFGIDTRMNYYFDDCIFKSNAQTACFYMHNRANAPSGTQNSSTITVNNCVMDTTEASGVSLGNGGASDVRIRVLFAGCHIGGYFKVGDEANKDQGTNPNTFDITLVRCNSVDVSIASSVNPYPAKIYN